MCHPGSPGTATGSLPSGCWRVQMGRLTPTCAKVDEQLVKQQFKPAIQSHLKKKKERPPQATSDSLSQELSGSGTMRSLKRGRNPLPAAIREGFTEEVRSPAGLNMVLEEEAGRALVPVRPKWDLL